jgi:hypothetical protein
MTNVVGQGAVKAGMLKISTGLKRIVSMPPLAE